MPNRRTFALVVAVIVALVSFPVAGMAQLSKDERDVMRGLTNLVVSADASDGVTKCGLRRESATLAAARSLMDSGLKVGVLNDGNSHKTAFWITLLGSSYAGGCAVAISVEVVSISEVAVLSHTPRVPAGSEILAHVPIRLFGDDTLLTGPLHDLPQRVDRAIRDIADKFATKVKLANQK